METNLNWVRYKEQKIKVRELTTKEMIEHEEQITEEIKQDKRGKEFWKNFRKISGKEVRKTELRINDEGKELERRDAEERKERFGNKSTRLLRIR